MIGLFKVRVSTLAAESVRHVLESGYLSQGPKVDLFEELLQKELNLDMRPVTVNSCTSALDLSLELCGVDVGDEVISTPQTCFASQIGILHRKAKIRWADIDATTGLIDPNSVEKLITKKTKAIMAVNWAGKLCDYKRLKQFGIPVIEDAAHTWDVFTKIPRKDRGDYICYSFQAIKFLTSGDGGLIVCPNEEKDHEARLLRWFGLDRTKNESFRCTQNITKPGFKYHLNDISAAIGICNIPEARISVQEARKNSQFLIENIKNKDIFIDDWDPNSSYWLLSIHVLNGRKKEFEKYMAANNIVVSPVHLRNDLYDSTIMFKENELPGVDSFDQTQVCIPNGWWLSSDELNYIKETINRF